MNIFEYTKYKKFVRDWVKSQPRGGYGQYKKLSDHLGVATVTVSQIFKGDRDLTVEQALTASGFLGLLEMEQRYFVELVRWARAASPQLRDYCFSEIQKMQAHSKQVGSRVKNERELTDNEKALFHSNWLYSGTRLAVDIPGVDNFTKVAGLLNVPPQEAKSVLEFLIKTGLVRSVEGRLEIGPQVVFLPKDSPHITSRQRSWRIKAFEKMDQKDERDLFYTCPLVCSEKSMERIRQMILTLIKESLDEVKPSPSEKLACLNIDWIRLS